MRHRHQTLFSSTHILLLISLLALFRAVATIFLMTSAWGSSSIRAHRAVVRLHILIILNHYCPKKIENRHFGQVTT